MDDKKYPESSREVTKDQRRGLPDESIVEGEANSSEDRSNSIDVVIDLISCKDEAYPISFP